MPARTGAAVRALCVVVVVAAVALAATGTVLLRERQAQAAAKPAATATLGGLKAAPGRAGWAAMANHDMDMKNGYQMPSAMMPGAPEGDEMRLGVPITLTNTTGKTRTFDLGREFRLGGGGLKAPRTMHSDNLGELPRLNPGNAVQGFLYFDIKVPAAGDPPLHLLWQRDGDEQRLTVRMIGSKPAHEHGS